ncbi:M56 family metallopeptidase [Aquisphaera insulae]|uniref:M56 family metallopeptidase n=1 Tax=Aquisphaera insulae TaxID=2712864 RepID=UPI0013EAA9A4|nr:M56 family metallopeptidase [Aquisphaera insulae]
MSLMTIVERIYPGDTAVAWLGIVSAGVALLAAMAVLAARLRWLARRPAPRHAVLYSALVGGLVMPLLAALVAAAGLAIAVPVLPAREAPAERERRANVGEAVAPISPLPSPSRSSEPARGGSVVTVDGAAAAFSPYRATVVIVLGLWAMGSLVLFAALARGIRRARSLRLSASPCDDHAVAAVLEPHPRRIRVLVSPGLATPVVVGIVRPAVILPDGLAGAISADELRDVLHHEMAHARRRDPVAVLLQGVARALYWPIVPVHLLGRELERAREEICDNHVLQDRDPLSYGETLLHLAELAGDHRRHHLAASAGILHWRGKLESRIAGLLDASRSTATRTPRALACGILVLFLGIGSLAASMRFVARAEAKEAAPTAPASPTTVPLAKADPPEAEGRSMLVHVIGPDGKSMAGVKIHVSVWTRPMVPRRNFDYVSDGEGNVRVERPPGLYIFRLWARADHHVPLFAHWEEAENPERTLPEEFTFHMARGTTIGGIIRDPDGKPIPGVTIEVVLSRGGKVEGRTSPNRWLAEGPTAVRTDAEGRWSLDNVPPGLDLDLRLKLAHPDYVSDANWGDSQQAQGVDLMPLRRRTAILTMRPGLVVTGIVTDPSGKPVARAVVVRGDNPYFEPGSQEILTDEAGRYTLPPLPAGKVNVTVIAEGWSPARRSVEIKSGMPPADFRLEPGKELRLRFVDGAGKAVPGVYVGIGTWRGGESLYNHKHPDVLDTKIPIQANDEGRFQWSWAPADAVNYRFGKEGFEGVEKAVLTADGREHTVILRQNARVRP